MSGFGLSAATGTAAPGAGWDGDGTSRGDGGRGRASAGLGDEAAADPARGLDGFHEQAQRLITSPKAKLAFDINKESDKVRDAYGRTMVGQQCLLARRLLEAGVTFVKVTHSNYDTHHENFDFHIEQLGEFDRTFATLVEDLHQRGMLESTLVVVMSEFGRTPTINRNMGRDHWSRAWSVAPPVDPHAMDGPRSIPRVVLLVVQGIAVLVVLVLCLPTWRPNRRKEEDA